MFGMVSKSTDMQTILGSGGSIGVDLARALREYTSEVRLVSRNPFRVHEDDQIMQADLTQPDQVDRAVKGSEVVYLTVGFPYRYKIWQKVWPVTMTNVINACKQHGSKLVFFDNIYMYDKDYLMGMDENTPVNPPSRKGQVRARIARMILEEIQTGNFTALIARSADFYGPSLENSVLTETVFKNFFRRKKAQWLGPLHYRHSFTYTPDAARATAILGNTPDAYNQVWHLPTAAPPLTGREWIETIAEGMGIRPRAQVLPPFLLRTLGIFNPLMKELAEMMYQNNRDYVFDSTKFEKRFGFQPTPYQQGITEIIHRDYQIQTIDKQPA